MGKKIKRIASLFIIMIFVGITAGCFINLAPTTVIDLWANPSTNLLYGAENSDDSLLVIQQGDLYGYADAMGKIVIKPQFTDARPFYEGLAAVERGYDKYGYIDETGKTIIPFIYYGVGDFHSGKALVGADLGVSHGETITQKISIIDVKGNELEKTEYNYIYGYSDGMTAVGSDLYTQQPGHFDISYLDGGYQQVATIRYASQPDTCGMFSEGFALFWLEGNKLSYMDKTGKQAFPGEFTHAEPFSKGLAAVAPGDGKLWGYINKTGQQELPPQYLAASSFGDGLAWVMTTENKWIIIEPSGKEVGSEHTPADARRIFSEGLCAVGKKNEEAKNVVYWDENFIWGFVDATGKLVIDFKYDMVTPFKNGIAQVLLNGKIGYIDKTGKYVWEPK